METKETIKELIPVLSIEAREEPNNRRFLTIVEVKKGKAVIQNRGNQGSTRWVQTLRVTPDFAGFVADIQITLEKHNCKLLEVCGERMIIVLRSNDGQRCPVCELINTPSTKVGWDITCGQIIGTDPETWDREHNAIIRFEWWAENMVKYRPAFLALYGHNLSLKWLGPRGFIGLARDVISRPDEFEIEDLMRAYGQIERAVGYAQARLSPFSRKYFVLGTVLLMLREKIIELVAKKKFKD